MNAVVFEHVQVHELPAAWQARLSKQGGARVTRVTVRIEEEPDLAGAVQALESIQANPLFGMWAQRDDMQDVAAHVRRLRAPRLPQDAAPHRK
ncbi:MAG: hypothetical protein ACT4NV_18430 [Rhodoferax sp.]